MFHYAMDYRNRGYSVIPLEGTEPVLDWRQFMTQHPTLGHIANWFPALQPCAKGIGIVTGNISRLIVVATSNQSDSQFWMNHRPKTPLMVEVSGIVCQFFYRAAKNNTLDFQADACGRCIEVFGNGCFVVAPPSFAADGNVQFRWTEEPEGHAHNTLPEFDTAWVESGQTIGEQSKEECHD